MFTDAAVLRQIQQGLAELLGPAGLDDDIRLLVCDPGHGLFVVDVVAEVQGDVVFRCDIQISMIIGLAQRPLGIQVDDAHNLGFDILIAADGADHSLTNIGAGNKQNASHSVLPQRISILMGMKPSAYSTLLE